MRSSHRRCSVRKGVLRNFVKFTGKHLLLLQNFAVSRSTWKNNYIKTWYIPLKRLESQDIKNQQDQFREVGQNILQARM